jgi:hypothetical protein
MVQVIINEQDQFYLIGDQKYHVKFPIDWALFDVSFIGSDFGSGPEYCPNCKGYNSINGIFIGYCSNCLQRYESVGMFRGRNLDNRMATYIEWFSNDAIAETYPYMNGFDKYSLNENLEDLVDFRDGEYLIHCDYPGVKDQELFEEMVSGK